MSQSVVVESATDESGSEGVFGATWNAITRGPSALIGGALELVNVKPEEPAAAPDVSSQESEEVWHEYVGKKEGGGNPSSPNADGATSAEAAAASTAALTALAARMESLEEQMRVKTDTLGNADEVAKAKHQAHSYFWKMEDCAESPCEMHQACIHFVLDPGVPFLYKLKYLALSGGTVFLQVLAILGLLSSVESMTETDINEMFEDLSFLDWFMHLMLCLLIGCVVSAEAGQAQIAEAQINCAWTSDDAAAASNARLWAPLLILFQKMRQLLLIPLTIATCPILALTEGVDSLSVALNVIATLFVFDIDELGFNALLSRSQRAYLGSVTIHLEPHDLANEAWSSIGIGLAVFFTVFFPMLLYDPDAIFASAEANQKFSPGFNTFRGEGEPTATLLFLVVVIFAVNEVFRQILVFCCHPKKGGIGCALMWGLALCHALGAAFGLGGGLVTVSFMRDSAIDNNQTNTFERLGIPGDGISDM